MKVSKECIHGVLQTHNSINYTLKQKSIVTTLSPISLLKKPTVKNTPKNLVAYRSATSIWPCLGVGQHGPDDELVERLLGKQSERSFLFKFF
jgi:hypothetical protein